MKKVLFGVIMVLFLGTIITIVIINNNKVKDQPRVELKEGKGKGNVILDEVTFSEIKTTYDGGITTLTATMINKTDKTKNFKIEIILKDKDGNALKSMFQVVEDLQPEKPKKIITGISGNHSNLAEVEFKIVE